MARRRWTRRKKKIFGSLLLLGTLSTVVIAAGLIIYAEQKLSGLVLGGLGESFSTKVFSAPYLLNEQKRPTPERLIERLRRLGYRPSSGLPTQAGEWNWEYPTLSVWLRGFSLPHLSQAAGLLRLTQETAGSWKIEDASGNPLSSIALEPELVAELSGADKIRREPAHWNEIPEVLQNAVIAAEDRTFWRHFGFDPRGLARALWSNLRGHGSLQGGSTITQQMAKNLLLTPERTLRRKLAEFLLALYLEIRYSKREILTIYLNHIYFGQDGLYSVAGVKAAAKFYFDQDPKNLDLTQAALLAGLIRSPYKYNPWRDPKAAVARRNFVLKAMTAQKMISPETLEAALARPLKISPRKASSDSANRALYFVSELVRQLIGRYTEEEIFRLGLSLYTSMDPLLQQYAQEALQQARAQAALITLDPHTGAVLALAGGKNFSESQFNRVTQARRQPGSAFKPFIYAAALETGITPASPLSDAPKKYKKDKSGWWEPKNFNGVYRGTVTVREALVHSLNAATLDLAQKTGVEAIVSFAKRLGITSALSPDLGLALGVPEVTLWELTSAYAPFANGGFYSPAYLMSVVTNADQTVLEFHSLERQQVLPPSLAYLLTSILQDVVLKGTASKILSSLQWNRTAAGKTGTTNEGRDAWFIGYTPELLTGVWAGDDSNRAMAASGSRDAVPIWASFMKKALAEYPEVPFEAPEGVIKVTIDAQTGHVAGSGCPQKREEIFVAGTEPTTPCPLHRRGLAGWWDRLFGKTK